MKDEHDGHGGSYVLDPKTGVRTLVSRTAEKESDAEAPKEQTPKPKKQKSSEGVTHA